jgi:hypothetical protein
MKKLVVVLGVLALVGGQAWAVDLALGEHLAKYADHSALYLPANNGTAPAIAGPRVPQPVSGAAGFVPGAEQRTIFRVTNIFDVGGNVEFDTSSPTELTGVLYDLALVGVTFVSPTDVILDFAPLGRNPLSGALVPAGGVLEVYEDATKDYTANPGGVAAYQTKLPTAPGVTVIPFDANAGPTYWTEGQFTASRDSYPTVTDGDYWLAAQLVDLNYLVGLGVVGVPGVPFAAGTVLRETLDLATGSGDGLAYGTVVGGSYAPFIDNNLFAANVGLALQFDLITPVLDPGVDQTFGTADDFLKDSLSYQGIGQWPVDSQDPVIFSTVIPEPTTLALLGLGLAGLGALRRRK